MSKNLFKILYGVIPACDVGTLDELKTIVKETSDIDGVVGYKIGCVLGLSYGLPKIVKSIKEFTDLPVIYDHQKASTDIPQMGEKFAETCKKAGVDSVIMFPQSGPQTEKAFIEAIFDSGLIPMVGGEMTHPKYLTKDGGFIKDTGPMEMYELAAKMGVEYFILPGNKPEVITRYNNVLSRIVDEPKYCMPGIGAQGGDIENAFNATGGNPSYAIIGSKIYKEKNIKIAARKFCEIALSFGL